MATVILRRYAFSDRVKLSSLEWNRCPVCGVIGVRFGVEYATFLQFDEVRWDVQQSEHTMKLAALDIDGM